MGSSIESKNANRVKNVKYVGTLADGGVWVYQASSNTMIPGVTEDGSIQFDLAFPSSTPEVIQKFRYATSISSIDSVNVDLIEIDINESGIFVTLANPGDLPLIIPAGDTITWRVTITGSKDLATMNLIGTETIV